MKTRRYKFPSSILERLEFFSRVDPVTGCRVWHGRMWSQGRYGRVYWHGESYAAHRVAWTLAFGSIPDGRVVCHTCDNGLCIEPTHMFLGDHRDNCLDKCRKGRSGLKAMTRDEIASIRDMLQSGMNKSAIARATGAQRRTVQRIAKGTAYQWVLSPQRNGL